MGWQAVDIARAARALPIGGALVLAVGASVATAAAAHAAPPAGTPAPGDYSVALEQCVATGPQPERSATFVAQMVANAATQKMAVKIDLEERTRPAGEYRTVLAPGLGEWRAAEPGVKIYKYVKQVTNLQAPASYRVEVHFRWVADKGRTIKRAVARSPRCFQPLSPAPVAPPAAVGAAAGS